MIINYQGVLMAKNMLDWFTILAFYETSDHNLDGETLLVIKHRALNRLRFLGKLIDGNKSQWIYRLFEKTYLKFNQIQHEHQAKGEWLVGCPIARHAKAHGYEELPEI